MLFTLPLCFSFIGHQHTRPFFRQSFNPLVEIVFKEVSHECRVRVRLELDVKVGHDFREAETFGVLCLSVTDPQEYIPMLPAFSVALTLNTDKLDYVLGS